MAHTPTPRLDALLRERAEAMGKSSERLQALAKLIGSDRDIDRLPVEELRDELRVLLAEGALMECAADLAEGSNALLRTAEEIGRAARSMAKAEHVLRRLSAARAAHHATMRSVERPLPDNGLGAFDALVADAVAETGRYWEVSP